MCNFLFQKSVMKTTWGVLDPPVGNTRLNVIRLISSLLQMNTSSVNQELIELNSIGVILVRTLCCLYFYGLLLRSNVFFSGTADNLLA